jgi:hypothetical protein
MSSSSLETSMHMRVVHGVMVRMALVMVKLRAILTWKEKSGNEMVRIEAWRMP